MVAELLALGGGRVALGAPPGGGGGDAGATGGPAPNDGGSGGAPGMLGIPTDDDDEEDAGDMGGDMLLPFLGFGRVGGAIFGGEGKRQLPDVFGCNVWKLMGGGGGGNSDSGDCGALAFGTGGPAKSCRGNVANGGGGGGT